MWMAAFKGDLEVVEALLSTCADWTKTREPTDGKTALDSAKEEGHTEIALLLEQAADKAAEIKKKKIMMMK